jgi:hypothetical protein
MEAAMAGKAKIIRETDLVKRITSTINNVLSALGERKPSSKYEIDDLGMPHKPKTLAKGKSAVYLFYCPKERGFLKIGRVGPQSGSRFSYQHYNPTYAKSNLANSILKDKKMSEKYGLSESSIADWIKKNCRRIDILVVEEQTPSKYSFRSELMEASLHYTFKPMYEGKFPREAGEERSHE